MDGVHFADGFDDPDRVAFGLTAPQLATAAVAAGCAYVVDHSLLPALLRHPLALLLLIAGAALSWGRWDGRPLLDWAVVATRFTFRSRAGSILLTDSGRSSESSPAPVEPPAPPPAANGGAPIGSPPDPIAPPPDEGDPAPWQRWLAVPGPGHDEPPAGQVLHPAEPMVPALEMQDSADTATATPLSRSPRSSADEATDPPSVLGVDEAETAWTSPHTTVDMDRTPLVLLPSLPAAPADTELPDGDLDIDDDAPAVIPLAPRLRWPDEETREPVVAVVDPSSTAAPTTPPRPQEGSPPIFVGATRRLAFFSLNGGSGRTTLATEVACLLAARGRYRTGADEAARPLRIALLDLDLRSATVSVRLGIPQPTVWDYLLTGAQDPARVTDFMVAHRSGVRALLGPPKPLSSTGTTLEPARVAEIVHQLEREGIHFIIIDVSADLNAVTTWVLSAVHDIYVVLTASARGVQDAYRTTEALRRLGLGHKLAYVVNRARGEVNFTDTMADLGGRVVATIPHDQRVEDAENDHRIASLDTEGPAAEAISALAAHIYPALGPPRRRGRLARLWKRHAG